MSDCFLGGADGKKVATGVFTKTNGTYETITITGIPFNPKNVFIVALFGVNYDHCLAAVCTETAAKTLIYSDFNSPKVYLATNPTSFTYSSGTLTITVTPRNSEYWRAGDYYWMASE